MEPRRPKLERHICFIEQALADINIPHQTRSSINPTC
jgi:hypothetical protein